MILFLDIKALRTQEATLRARSAIIVTWELQDKSADIKTLRSLTASVGYMIHHVTMRNLISLRQDGKRMVLQAVSGTVFVHEYLKFILMQ